MIFYNVNDLGIFIGGIEKKPVIGFTSGCFDLIHPLHVDYLNKCRRYCDFLIVLVDTDKLVRDNKQKTPLINELDRAYMLDNLRAVDVVSLVDSIYQLKLYMAVLGNFANEGKISGAKMFKHKLTIYGSDLLKTDGVEIVIVPDVNRFNSTTDITNFLKQ